MYINYSNLLDLREDLLSGVHSGILSYLPIVAEPYKTSSSSYVFTAVMPSHSRLSVDTSHEMSYHIAGYGLLYNEAKIRYIGESVERYASVMAKKFLTPRVLSNLSYDEMLEISKQKEKVLPKKYLNILTQNQKETLSSINPIFVDTQYTDQKLDWVKTNCLFSNESVYVPSHLFFVGDETKNIYAPSFTTGTACHENEIEAMINGLIEIIQIDAFMYNWYSDCTRKELDLSTLPDHVKALISNVMGDLSETHELHIYDYGNNAKVNIVVLGIFIVDKLGRFPAISFGVQGGLDISNVLYRGIQEALAIVEMNKTLILSDRGDQKFVTKNHSFTDLDTNVLSYSLGKNFKDNWSYITKHVNGSISYEELESKTLNFSSLSTKNKLKTLIRELEQASKYACFLDITPSNLKDNHLKVIRTFIPELLTMSLPSFPPIAHERFKDVNVSTYPHPLA